MKEKKVDRFFLIIVFLLLAAGIAMGCIGERLSQRDVAIGLVLSLGLGFGLLFLHFFTASATQATSRFQGSWITVAAMRRR